MISFRSAWPQAPLHMGLIGCAHGRSGRVISTNDVPDDRLTHFPRQRTYLLPALLEAQQADGWLSPEVIERIAAHLRVPKSEAYGVASSYPELRLRESDAKLDRVCLGPVCRTAGGQEIATAWSHAGRHYHVADCLFACAAAPVVELEGALRGRATPGLPTVPRGDIPSELCFIKDGSCSRAVNPPATDAELTGIFVGCAGNCWQTPSFSRDGGHTWEGRGSTWRAPGELRLLDRAGRCNPLDMQDYTALEQALSLGSDRVWKLVKDSGLRGRGGAYFPVGLKWETARTTPAESKYLVVNAEEGEPGIYKDRHLMEGDPHRLIEGLQIAALAIGATTVILFINGEARLSHERILRALQQARAAGCCPVPTEVRQGAGGYVLGEETALINAIHGYRSEPLARPPFPAVSGLQASPTVINNAETLANLPDIIRHGADWFRSMGTPDTPGTKLVSLAGDVNQPGLYEVPLGTPISEILAVWGGGAKGPLKALLAGGPSGSILPASLADTSLDVLPLQEVGGVLGAGGIVALNDSRCPVDMVRGLVAYNARESCGKCTPCREGTVRVQLLFDRLVERRAAAADLETLDYLNDILTYGSLCGLGQMAPNPVRALLRHFGDEVREHLAGECRVGACP